MIVNYRLKTPQDLLNDFSALLASFINCGLTIVTTNELEYGEYIKRHCSTYRLKSEDKRKNAFDEEDEDDENTVSRSSSTR